MTRHWFFMLLIAPMMAVAAPPPSSNPSNVARRVVTFSPALTEIAYALGGGDEIVGVSEFCVYPPAAAAKPVLGGIMNPSLEQFAVLRPTCVLAQSVTDTLRAYCRHTRTPLIIVPLETWADITNGVLQVGTAFGRAAAAARLQRSLCTRWDALRRRGAAHPAVPALLSIWRSEGAVAACTTVSRASFLAELLAAAGGSNVCADVLGPYPTVAAEVLLARQPRVIIELRPGEALSAAIQRRLRRDWRHVAGMPAVAAQRIFFVTNSAALIPGPRLLDVADEFAAIFEEAAP